MSPGTMLAAAAALVAGVAWLAWPEDATAPATEVAARAAGTAAPPADVAPRRSWFEEVPAPVPPAAIDEARPAAASMAQTRLHGDPLAPPIARDSAPRERPTEAELADPKAYQAYEARQTMRLYAAYVSAVEQELPRLREDIARGRALGIPAHEIAKAEEKARAMEQMRAQLLKDHPELGR